MANQQWVSLLNPASAYASGAGTALSTAVTGIISPTTGLANQDVAQVNPSGWPLGWYAGLLIRVTARGFITTVSTAGTLTFLLQSRVGNAGTTYVTLATSTTLTTTTSVFTGLQWKLEALIRCTGVAKTGATVSTEGEMDIAQTTATQSIAQTPSTVLTPYKLWLPTASGETAASVDTTQLQGINLACTQATSTCTVQLTQWLAEALD
jgi:hypothetical protein